MRTTEDGRGTAPWLFSLLILPLGIAVGFKFTPLPFLLAQAGVPVYRIAAIASIVHLPAVLVFLWATARGCQAPPPNLAAHRSVRNCEVRLWPVLRIWMTG